MGQFLFYQRFNTEHKCFKFLRKMQRQKKQIRCQCGSCRRWITKKSNGCFIYTCKNCRSKWSDLFGTPFEGSRTPLTKWFITIYEFTHNQAISAITIKKKINVTYKTAWRMLFKIRESLWLHQNRSLFLSGVVEVDETYTGGRRKGKRGRGAAGKSPVIGFVSRGGDAFAQKIQDVSSFSLHQAIVERIEKGATLITDEWRGYNGTSDIGYKRFVINHGDNFVKEQLYTNSVEGFWSLFKRKIKGVHVSVSPKYLNYYLAEATFKYNLRLEKDPLNAIFNVCLVPLRG